MYACEFNLIVATILILFHRSSECFQVLICHFCELERIGIEIKKFIIQKSYRF